MGLFTAKSLRASTIVATLAAVAVLGFVFAGDVLARDTGAFAYSGRVVHVVDGDTVDVALKSSKRVRVRVIGIDTPEVGTCYAAAATTRMIQLVSSKNVVLHGDATQATRDRYSRLLAYVDVGRRDAGATLVREGYARVYIYGGRPFLRTAAYQKAEEGARQARRGLWATCAASGTTAGGTTASGRACDPSYPDFCIPPPPPDLDCKDIARKGFKVLPPDPHRFDGDHDGIGCES